MKSLATTLLTLPVVTESGIKLGRVENIECDVSDWSIHNIQVTSGIFHKSLLVIAVAQIVRVEPEQIVVEDAAVPSDLAAKLAKGTVAPIAPSLN